MSRSFKKVAVSGIACDNHGLTSKYYTDCRRRNRRTSDKIEVDEDDLYISNLVVTSHKKHSRKTIHDAYREPTDGRCYWWNEESGNKRFDPYYKYKRK